MPAIRLTGFSGEQPRVIPRLMPDNAAQVAVNCRLDDGALTPIRRAAQAAAAQASWRTIYRAGDEWLGWSGIVHVAPGPVDGDRLYIMGDGAPKMRLDNTIYPLALPRPGSRLTPTLQSTGAGDVSTRLYAFTWVTTFGEESEPSPVSASVQWRPGNKVRLSGFPVPPAGRAIVKQRIYRSQTGKSGTYLYLIAERDAANTNFIDDIAVDALQDPLPSADWNAPPSTLIGLVSLPNGLMAAFAGRKIYFCEPYRPHAWPDKYILTVDSDIVGLAALGQSLLVMTEGQPYVINGTTPAGMVTKKLELNLPCISRRGIVDLGYAVAYPSNDGLVVARPDGSASIATSNIFSPDDWKALNPEAMVGAQYAGRYVASYRYVDDSGQNVRGLLHLDLAGTSFLVRTDVFATAFYFDGETGGLYFVSDTAQIMRFDAPGAAPANLTWRSKQFVLPYPENFAAILVDVEPAPPAPPTPVDEAARDAAIAERTTLLAAGPTGGELAGAILPGTAIAGDLLPPVPGADGATAGAGVTVRVIADGKLVAVVSAVNEPRRLPGGFRARSWEIEVVSDRQVQAISIAKSIDELRVLA